MTPRDFDGLSRRRGRPLPLTDGAETNPGCIPRRFVSGGFPGNIISTDVQGIIIPDRIRSTDSRPFSCRAACVDKHIPVKQALTTHSACFFDACP